MIRLTKFLKFFLIIDTKREKFFRRAVFLQNITNDSFIIRGFSSLSKKRNIDVLLHELVPKHILLSKEETEELLDTYKIDLIDLPQMFEKDPVALAIGAKEGDVVKIIRDSQTTVKKVNYYRYVKKEKV